MSKKQAESEIPVVQAIPYNNESSTGYSTQQTNNNILADGLYQIYLEDPQRGCVGTLLSCHNTVAGDKRGPNHEGSCFVHVNTHDHGGSTWYLERYPGMDPTSNSYRIYMHANAWGSMGRLLAAHVYYKKWDIRSKNSTYVHINERQWGSDVWTITPVPHQAGVYRVTLRDHGQEGCVGHILQAHQSKRSGDKRGEDSTFVHVHREDKGSNLWRFVKMENRVPVAVPEVPMGY